MPSKGTTVARVCGHCGVAFQGEPYNPGRFCSRRCTALGTAKRITRITKACEQCSIAFQWRPSKNGSPQRFCSKSCFALSQRQRLCRNCLSCDQAFETTPALNAQYCKRGCADAGLVIPLMDRIWKHIDIGAPNECWPWTAKRHPRGYGETSDRGKDLRVSRVMLEDKLGRPLGEGMMALHTCSNPPCCNPAHLFEGTHKTNMEQRKAEGKYPTGDAHPRRRHLLAPR